MTILRAIYFFIIYYQFFIGFFLYGSPTSKLFKRDEITFESQKNEAGENIQGIPYTIKFKGDVDDEFIESFKKVSELIKLSNRLPSSITGLGKRADQDKKKIRKILASKGYLGAKVDFRLSQKENRMVVKFNVKSGDVYKISSIDFDILDNPHLFDHLTKEICSTILDLYIGEKVSFDKSLNAITLIKRYWQTNGYPYIEVEKPIGYVDHKNKTLKLTYKIKTGILCKIQSVSVYGLKDIQEEFIRNRLTLKKEDLYSIEEIERTKGKLAETQLIVSTVIEPNPINLKDCILDENENPIPQPTVLKTTIKEGPPRAIGAGIRYSESEKLSGNLYWHHNNLFGNQEHLGVSFKSNLYMKRAKLVFDFFDVGAPLQSLSFESIYQYDSDPFSYDGNTKFISSSIQRPFDFYNNLKASIGISFEEAELTQNNFLNPSYNFYDQHKIVGVPLSLSMDTTLKKQKLDPANGFRIKASFLPYYGEMNGINNLLIIKANISHYLPIMKTPLGDPLFVLASFFHSGQLIMSNDIPPPLNKRFFAGGSSSIRSYGHRMLSPFATTSDQNVVFLGGRSLLEIGSELRYRINEDWGCVAFLEAGSIDNAALKVDTAVKNPILWGGGIGIRYFTSFAPIRIDIAFPAIKRRDPGTNKTIDSPYQFYISVGQAF